MRTALGLALAAAALCLPVSIAASNAALAALTLALLLRWRGESAARARALARNPALRAVAAYVAAGLLSAAFGVGPKASLHDCAKDLHRLWSLSLFVGALALEPAAPLTPAFAAGFGFAALVGVGQSLAGLSFDGSLARARAFVHPVTFGEMMAFAVMGGLCLLARPRDEENPAARPVIAWTALVGAALFLSQTRAALLALGAGALALAVLEPRARRWAAGALGLGALGAVAGELLRYGRHAFTLVPGTRAVLWRVAWRMFLDHPLTGAGPSHYRTLFTGYFQGVLEGEADWGTAHNLYLHQLAERGVIGELALLALFGVLLTRAWRAARARRDAAALWAACAVPAFLVMNLTETAFQTEQFATLFLLIWAFGAREQEGQAYS